ncbi:hypothetical protein ACFL1H_01790 [Nanoarchaeota archaeon]
MNLENITFDEDGEYYLVDDGHITQADDYEFISKANIMEDDYKENIFYVTFKDSFLGDFENESIARDLDEHLEKLEGIEKLYWEDSEYFHITYKEGQDLPTLIKSIDDYLIKLSKEE